MKTLKLASLRVDDMCLEFKDGMNYIIGKNGAGKTTIFNCIKYAFGLDASSLNSDIYSVELDVRIDDREFCFRRDVGDSHVAVSSPGWVSKFRPKSKELNEFLSDSFEPTYIFGRQTESVFALLDLCFLSEERSANRRKQWEAINSVCGINVSFLKSVENDIHSLEKEVSKNKELQKTVRAFSGLLSERLGREIQSPNLSAWIENVQSEYFNQFREKEDLLVNASSKLEELKRKSEYELKDRIAEIERVFVSLKNYAGYEWLSIGDIESFVKGRNDAMSYGEEIYSKFILILAIAKVSQNGLYNFPGIIVNDSYLSPSLDERTLRSIFKIVKDATDKSKNLQYIEFTYIDDMPEEHIVRNLNAKDGRHVFID